MQGQVNTPTLGITHVCFFIYIGILYRQSKRTVDGNVKFCLKVPKIPTPKFLYLYKNISFLTIILHENNKKKKQYKNKIHTQLESNGFF